MAAKVVAGPLPLLLPFLAPDPSSNSSSPFHHLCKIVARRSISSGDSEVLSRLAAEFRLPWFRKKGISVFRAINTLWAVFVLVRKMEYSESSLLNVAHNGSRTCCGFSLSLSFCEVCEGSVTAVLPVPPLLVSEVAERSVCEDRRGFRVPDADRFEGFGEIFSRCVGCANDGTVRLFLLLSAPRGFKLGDLACGFFLPKYALARFSARPVLLLLMAGVNASPLPLLMLALVLVLKDSADLLFSVSFKIVEPGLRLVNL